MTKDSEPVAVRPSSIEEVRRPVLRAQYRLIVDRFSDELSEAGACVDAIRSGAETFAEMGDRADIDRAVLAIVENAGLAREAMSEVAKGLSLELMDRGVPKALVAEAAHVARATVYRWQQERVRNGAQDLPSGSRIRVLHNPRGDFTIGGISATAEFLTIVGYRDQRFSPRVQSGAPLHPRFRDQRPPAPLKPVRGFSDEARGAVALLPRQLQVDLATPDAPPAILVSESSDPRLLPAIWDEQHAAWRLSPVPFTSGGNAAQVPADGGLSVLLTMLGLTEGRTEIGIHDRNEPDHHE